MKKLTMASGKEKRFAINTQITSRQDAYRLIQDIAGAFRGMVFWAGGMVNVMQDSPSDPVMMFTNANVKDGMFSYKGSARKDRPSVALVTYNNKEDGYKQNIEYVEDREAMRRYGERKTEVVAFGCTSRGGRIVSVCGCCIPHAWSPTLSALRQGWMLPS